MDLKAKIKAQFSVLKNGLLLAYAMVLLFYLFYWIWGAVLSLGCNPFQSNLVNFSVKVIVFACLAYMVGRAFENNAFKQMVFNLLEKVPIVGILVESVKFLDRIKTEGAPEVLCESFPGSGIWFKGWVSKEWKDERTGKMMCGVVFPMFVHPIGAYVVIEKEKLRYSGKRALETIIECISGGLIAKK